MTGTADQSALPHWLGGASPLVDAGRWRALAAQAGHELATMREAALLLRAEFAPLDLITSLRALASLAEGSHAVARLTQADLEAATLYEAAGEPVPAEMLAFFPGETGVRATRGVDGGWRLDGTQHRSVHPAAVDRALLVATTDDGQRLFNCSMTAPGVVRDRAPIRTIAPEDPNGPVTFTGTPASPVGTAAWWAARPRSFDGLLRDASCWFGSCVWLCGAVEATLAVRPDGLDLLRVGRVDVWVHSARLALRDAAAVVAEGPTGPTAELAARRAVAVVATTIDTVVRMVAALSDARVTQQHALLPTRVAQLQIAQRRFDAEANLRAVARLAADGRTGRRVTA